MSPDGAGIPEAERDRLFEAGYSGEADGWELAVTGAELGGGRFEIRGMGAVDAEAATGSAE